MTMRFVHLAPRAAIGRIRRHGLRQGTGRCGGGLYCVPLLGIPRAHRDDCDDTPRERVMTSDRAVTSMTLWTFLFRYRKSRWQKPMAVVFEPPASAWPADLYLEPNARLASQFLTALAPLAGTDFEVVDRSGAGFAELMFTPSLRVRVYNEAGVGTVMHHLLACGARAWSDWDDRFELVFHQRIEASAIRKIVPLCRRTREARDARNARNAREQHDAW